MHAENASYLGTTLVVLYQRVLSSRSELAMKIVGSSFDTNVSQTFLPPQHYQCSPTSPALSADGVLSDGSLIKIRVGHEDCWIIM